MLKTLAKKAGVGGIFCRGCGDRLLEIRRGISLWRIRFHLGRFGRFILPTRLNSNGKANAKSRIVRFFSLKVAVTRSE